MLTTNYITFIVLLLSFIATFVLCLLISQKIAKSQLKTAFSAAMICLIICDIGQLLQMVLSKRFRDKTNLF